MAGWTLDELGRDVTELRDGKQDKEAYDVWKMSVDEWRRAHDERHQWLVRALTTLALTTLVELIFLIIRLLQGSGIT